MGSPLKQTTVRLIARAVRGSDRSDGRGMPGGLVDGGRRGSADGHRVEYFAGWIERLGLKRIALDGDPQAIIARRKQSAGHVQLAECVKTRSAPGSRNGMDAIGRVEPFVPCSCPVRTSCTP